MCKYVKKNSIHTFCIKNPHTFCKAARRSCKSTYSLTKVNAVFPVGQMICPPPQRTFMRVACTVVRTDTELHESMGV